VRQEEAIRAIETDPRRARRELDPAWFMEEYIWIYDKNQKRVRLKLNNIQREIYNPYGRYVAPPIHILTRRRVENPIL
jgi:hypothetical protein